MIFQPFQSGSAQNFTHDERLLQFVISVNWRVLYSEIDSFEKDYPLLGRFCKEALSTWQDYLLGKASIPGTYEHHIFFLDLIERAPSWIHPKAEWYFLRTIDATIAFSDDVVSVYTKLPGIILMSAIKPSSLNGWKGTKIGKSGKVGTPQEISQPDYFDFLMSRVKVAFDKPISGTQWKKMLKSISKDKSRLLRSRSGEILGREMLKEYLPN